MNIFVSYGYTIFELEEESINTLKGQGYEFNTTLLHQSYLPILDSVSRTRQIALLKINRDLSKPGNRTEVLNDISRQNEKVQIILSGLARPTQMMAADWAQVSIQDPGKLVFNNIATLAFDRNPQVSYLNQFVAFGNVNSGTVMKVESRHVQTYIWNLLGFSAFEPVFKD